MGSHLDNGYINRLLARRCENSDNGYVVHPRLPLHTVSDEFGACPDRLDSLGPVDRPDCIILLRKDEQTMVRVMFQMPVIDLWQSQ